jgi:hypothetical protein
MGMKHHAEDRVPSLDNQIPQSPDTHLRDRISSEHIHLTARSRQTQRAFQMIRLTAYDSGGSLALIVPTLRNG